MTDTGSFAPPTDGPTPVLVRLVRKKRLPYSSVFIAGRSAAHPQPDSLLSLVEIGAEVGLKITAARTDADGIDELQRPAVVHFSSDDGGGGFGVLEAVTSSGFRIWDSAHGRRTVPRETFLQQWSGIVGLVERDDSARAVETGFRRNRMLELLAGGSGPPALAGSRAARPLQIVVAALGAALVAAALVDHPTDSRPAAIALATLAVLGLAITIGMALATSDPSRPFALPGCPRGKRVDCQSVLTSPYSRVLGIPLSEIGIAFFAAILAVLVTSSIVPQTIAPWAVAGGAFLLSIPFSLGLVALQVAMKQFCTLCMAVHVINLAGAVTGLSFVGDRWSTRSFLVSVVVFVLFFCLALFLAVPYFTRTQRLRAVVEDQQRIVSSPFATLAYLQTGKPTPVSGARCGVRLPGPAAARELVVFVHPSCAQCARTIGEVSPLAAAGWVELYLALAPKDAKGPDREACASLVAASLALGPDAFLAAYGAAKGDFQSFMSDPLHRTSSELNAEPEVLAAHLDQARSLVGEAERLADAHVDGTPALFFESRLFPYAAPVAHLEFLLARHAELLPGGTSDERATLS